MGAILSKRLLGFLGITPHAKVGQVIITVAVLGGATGSSMFVDKALYQSMGLCKLSNSHLKFYSVLLGLRSYLPFQSKNSFSFFCSL